MLLNLKRKESNILISHNPFVIQTLHQFFFSPIIFISFPTVLTRNA